MLHTPKIQGVANYACCRNLRCPKTCNESILKMKQELSVNGTRAQRCSRILSMKGSEGHFYFNGGHQDWNQFLMNAFRFRNDMQRNIWSCPRPFLRESNNMKTSETEQNYSSAKPALLPLATAAINLYLDRTVESCRDQMLDMPQLHFPFF